MQYKKYIDKGSRNLAVLYGYDGRYITAASDPKIQRALMFDSELVKMRIKSDRRALRDRVRDKYGIDIGNVQVELWWVEHGSNVLLSFDGRRERLSTVGEHTTLIKIKHRPVEQRR